MSRFGGYPKLLSPGQSPRLGWEREDQNSVRSEGWMLGVQTVRIRSRWVGGYRPFGDPRVNTDSKAWVHVWVCAQAGREQHRKALDFVKRHNFPHFLQIAAWCTPKRIARYHAERVSDETTIPAREAGSQPTEGQTHEAP